MEGHKVLTPHVGVPKGFLEELSHIRWVKVSCTEEGGKGIPGDMTAGAKPGGIK